MNVWSLCEIAITSRSGVWRTVLWHHQLSAPSGRCSIISAFCQSIYAADAPTKCKVNLWMAVPTRTRTKNISMSMTWPTWATRWISNTNSTAANTTRPTTTTVIDNCPWPQCSSEWQHLLWVVNPQNHRLIFDCYIFVAYQWQHNRRRVSSATARNETATTWSMESARHPIMWTRIWWIRARASNISEWHRHR